MYGTGTMVAFLMDDPRVPSVPYTQQPLQRLFNESSNVQGLTGWPRLWSGDAIISRTCWKCASGSLLVFDNATFSGASGTYDAPRLGNLTFWKGGGVLLGGDQNPSNTWWANDPSTQGDTFNFNNASSGGFLNGLQGSIGITPITSWSSQYAGTYGVQYGDSQSRYAAGCGNEAPGYNTASLNITIDHAVRCFAHLKQSGYDEFIVQFDDVELASGSPTTTIPMAWHLQYPENGQTQSGFGGYTTGSTTLSSGVITSLEDGNSGRTYGLKTAVLSPGSITLRDDCSGLAGGQCSPSATYSGGLGYTHRFSICGGSSCGADVSSFVSLTVHKVMQSLTDSTFNVTAINPDSNWTGAQVNGAVSCAVVMEARGGVRHATMSSFTPSSSSGVCANNVQYLFGGLTPGSYNVTVGGNTVSGSPFTVTAGDNSIEFTGVGGTVSLNVGGGNSSSGISGQISIGGNVIVH
jgi:hypothetical protein